MFLSFLSNTHTDGWTGSNCLLTGNKVTDPEVTDTPGRFNAIIKIIYMETRKSGMGVGGCDDSSSQGQKGQKVLSCLLWR